MDTHQTIELYIFTLLSILSIWTCFLMDKFFKFVHIEKKAVLECDEINFKNKYFMAELRDIRPLYFRFLESHSNE